MTTLSPTGIDASALGSASIDLGVSPSGIDAAVAGEPTIGGGTDMVLLFPTGIASGLAFGTAAVSSGSTTTISPAGIAPP